jgi:RNA polymerase sigma factor (sigma-70 family)
MPDNDDPVTLWIDELRLADEVAAQKLWEHFVSRLYDLARKKLRPETRRTYDEEDAAQSAFRSFCAGLVAGRFPDLRDRESLWHLLLAIAARKVAHRHRHDQQDRRDVRRNLATIQSMEDSAPALIEGMASHEPTPEFAAQFVETCESFYQRLDDPALQQVVALRLESYTDDEIAERVGCSRRTVQRRLELVRRHWTRWELSLE